MTGEVHLLAGGPAVLHLAASLVALDLASGKVLWRFEPPAASGLAPAAAGPLLVAAADNGLLYGIGPEGRVIWRLRAPGEIAAPPVLWKGIGLGLFSNDRGGSLLAFDPASGKRAWEAPLDFAPTGPPVPFRGRVALAGLVAGDPVVTALEPSGRTAWATGIPLGAGALALAARERGLAAKSSGGACLALDPAGRISWTQPQCCEHPPPGNLPPSAARGVLLVPSEQVLALDAGSGGVLGSVPVTAPARWLVSEDLSVTAADAQGLVTAVRLRTHLSLVIPNV